MRSIEAMTAITTRSVRESTDSLLRFALRADATLCGALGLLIAMAVLRRFLGSRSGRKARYAALLVEALEPGREPAPLAGVLARV